MAQIVKTANSILINGDNLKVLPVLAKTGVKYDCIFTDPPYGTADEKGGKVGCHGGVVKQFNIEWDKELPTEWFSIAIDMLKEGGCLIWWTDNIKTGMLRELVDSSGKAKFMNTIAWCKPNPPPTPRKNFSSAIESAIIARKNPKIAYWNGGGATRNVFEDAICSGHERSTTSHPTPKPISLVAKLLKIVCPPGGRILDPFAGSFSTGMAAVLLGMKPTCIELDETYFKEGVERMKDAENPYGPYSLDKDGNLKAEKTNRGQASLFDISGGK